MGYYVTAKGGQNIKTYRYHGEDRSLIYRFILTPMNKQLINFMPRFLAPNVISLSGLVIIGVVFAIMLFYTPSLDQQLPPWLCYTSAFAFFCYQTLDNLDGMQARRTGSSSPLGLLFDHGVDAINTSTGVVVAAGVMQAGASWKMFAIWMSGIILFIGSTWEEYYTNKLTLPIINGPSDGQVLTMIICVAAGVWPGIWTWRIGDTQWAADLLPAGSWLLSQPWNTIFPFICIASAPLTILLSVVTVRKHSPLGPALLRLFPFIVFCVGVTAWFMYSPTNIYATHPRIFMLAHGFLFGNLITKLMLAHLCKMEYKILRSVLVPLVLALILIFVPVLLDMRPLVPEAWLLYGCGAFAFGTWLHFAVNVIEELTTILGIRCFTIPLTEVDHSASVQNKKKQT